MSKDKKPKKLGDPVAYLLVVELRRSNAASPGPSKKRYTRKRKHRRDDD